LIKGVLITAFAPFPPVEPAGAEVAPEPSADGVVAGVGASTTGIAVGVKVALAVRITVGSSGSLDAPHPLNIKIIMSRKAVI
jgi:hypothetical protein